MGRLYNLFYGTLLALSAALGAFAGYRVSGSWIGGLVGALFLYVLAVNLVYLLRAQLMLSRVTRATSVQHLAQLTYPGLILNGPGVITMIGTGDQITAFQGALNQASMNDAIERRAPKAEVITIREYPWQWTLLVRLLLKRRIVEIRKTP